MNFDQASSVEQVCYDIRMADYPRSLNRARINNLFNGLPPFSDDEENKINVNPLTGTVMAHDARAQFYGAFLRPGRYFDAKTDVGPTHKRGEYSRIVTKEMNRIMKASKGYFETFRSKFAMDVLHGIGPAVWRNPDKWMPDAIGIEDIGIPASTLLTMENLPFFYVYRQFTVPELMKLTNCANVEPGWNMPLVKKLMEFIDVETRALMGTDYPEVWSPEKTQERLKGDGSYYSADRVPTINVFDFYFWNDDDKVEGWNRRMILDAWAEPTMSGQTVSMPRNAKMDFSKNNFLFNSKKKKYADKLSEIITFQFADLSAVAPFRYHSVRSLGYLVYGVCHLQNRMFCRFNESAFEATMNYLRVNSPDDADRALKIDLMNRGIIDKSVEFVKQQDRWQVNTQLIEAAMGENKRIVDSNTSSFTAQPPQGNPSTRKTKLQVMAEVNQTTALVTAAFNQAYRYQEDEYTEIFRRFFKRKSGDIDVSVFRARCLSQGVPEKCLLDPCSWELFPTQVMGAGNKTAEMAITEQLLQMRPLFDPEPQRDILRRATFNITGDPSLSEEWVPDQPVRVTDSVHDAQLATGVLMQGLPVSMKTGMNHKEYVTTLVGNLQLMIQKAMKAGGMATQKEIEGYQAVAQLAMEHLKILSQDKSQKAFVADAQKLLSKLMNEVRAFAQRLQEQMKKQQEQAGAGQNGEAQAKIQGQVQMNKVKLQSRQAETAQKLKAKEQEHQQKMHQEAEEFRMEQHRMNVEALHEHSRKTLASLSDEPEHGGE
jgi:hypothetical protein